MRRALAAVGVTVATTLALSPVDALGVAPAADRAARQIPLVAPVHDVDPLRDAAHLGLRPDRLLTSVVPGPVANTEQVTVGIGPSGAPAVVTDLQQLVITAAGNYIVRELGPARAAAGLGDTVPPVLELGQVVWQGFSPGTRTLRALLTLDPAIEAHRLPMTIGLSFTDRQGHSRALGAGGRAPADGTATVTLSNATGSPRAVGLGVAATRPLAAALQTLYDAARAPRAAVPPHAGAGLPLALPGSHAGDEQVTVVAPLRVTGSIGAGAGSQSAVHGPGTTPSPAGADIAGTLDGSAEFTVDLRSGQSLHLDLDVRPWLDPRTLVPPGTSWRAWGSGHPAVADVRAATTTLAEAAAAAARSAEYSPYLQADTPGTDLSTFHYVVAPATATPRAVEAIRARPGAITAAVLALAAIAGNAALLWRRL